MAKRVTAEEVASRAGVSRTTVSFVINNTPGKSISEETRQRILRAAQELGYRPDETARNLAMTKRHSVGLFICHSHHVFSDAFVIRIIEGMAPVLNKGRYRLIIRPLRLDQSDYSHLAAENQVEGIILMNTHDGDNGLAAALEGGLPMVVIGSVANPEVYQVDVDNLSASRAAVDHLVGLGHARIAMISHAPGVYSAARLRVEGYRQAIEGAGLAFREEWVRFGDFTEDSGCSQMEQLLSLKEKPTAVFVGNDVLAVGAMRAAADAGLAIPNDISIAGFDDDLLSRYLDPPLTTVALPSARLGAEAVTLLIRRLSGKELPALRRVVLPVHLAVRGSTGPARDNSGGTDRS